MNIYNLAADEAVYFECHQLKSHDSIVISSRNIILVSKSGLIRSGDLQKYSLASLKTIDSKPNIILSKLGSEPSLQICLSTDTLYVSFLHWIDAKKCEDSILKAYKAFCKEMSAGDGFSFGKISDKVKGSVGSIRTSIEGFGIKPGPRIVKCPYCGAQIEGNRGDTVSCQYCEHKVQL